MNDEHAGSFLGFLFEFELAGVAVTVTVVLGAA